MPRGNWRRVLLIGPFAVKVARSRFWHQARCCNRWEREMWRIWRPRFNWQCLCPILLSDRFGFIVVMRRAEQPVTVEQIEAVAEPLYPDVTCEWKTADCGRLDGRIVALDYGLPDEDSIAERRAYYGGFAPRLSC